MKFKVKNCNISLILFLVYIILAKITCHLNVKSKLKLGINNQRYDNDTEYDPYEIVDNLKIRIKNSTIELYENSSFIDLGNYIRDVNEQNQVSGLVDKINKVFDIIPLLMIVPEISDKFYNPKNKLKQTYLFLKDVMKVMLKKYSIDMDRMILIIFSIKDRQTNIRSCKKFRHKFHKEDIEEILGSLNPYLESEEYGKAAIKILQIIYERLENKQKQLYIKFILLFFILSLSVIIISTILYKPVIDPTKKKEDSAYTGPSKKMTIDETLEKFDRLNKLMEDNEDAYKDMCLVCIEQLTKNKVEFDNSDSDIALDGLEKDNDDNHFDPNAHSDALSTLRCFHVFHFDCIQYFYRTYTKECPYCLWKIEQLNVDKSIYGLSLLIKIHLELNKDLIYYNLEIKEGKILWKVGNDVKIVITDTDHLKTNTDYLKTQNN